MEEKNVWLMLYAGLVSIDNHPRNPLPGTAVELADKADEYLAEYLRRYPCPDTQSEQ